MKGRFALNQKEIWKGAILSFLLACLAFFPTIYGAKHTPPDTIFIGSGGTDEFNHLAWISQAAAGKWLFRSPYYLGDLPSLFFHPFYLLLGLIVKVTQYPAPLIFSLIRFPLSFVFFVSVFLCIAYFVKEKALRVPMFLTASLGGGLVWLDFQNPDPDWIETAFTRARHHVEANTFFIAKQDQTAMLATSLLIWSFLFFVHGLTHETRQSILLSGVSATLLLLVHPFMAVPAFLILLTFLLVINWFEKRIILPLSPKHLKALLLFTLTCLPSITYHLYLILKDPMFKSWAFEWMPPPLRLLDLATLFGFLLLPLPFGAKQLVKGFSPKNIFLLVWPVVTLTTAYLYPYNFGSRMMEGVHLPLAIAAVLGIKTFSSRFDINFSRLWLFFFILITPSTFYLLRKDLSVLNRHLPDHYVSKDLVRTTGWIDGQTTSEETVLASFYNAYAVSALTGNKVFGGVQAFCPPEQPSSSKQAPQCFPVVLDKSLPRDQELTILEDLNIHYFLISKTSSPVGRRGEGPKKVYTYNETQGRDYLNLVYENPSVVLYKVRQYSLAPKASSR